ncbi:MAG: prepilin-type N-terminal cleavage/methylation domain-containing protein [Desulfobacterales bacterium]|jgi:prepilin-type N-terminal cleavage/methylation domain-containing protein
MMGPRLPFGRNHEMDLDSKAGFSLIELLMAMGISMVILLAIYQVFTITSKNFTTQNVAANAQQSLRSAIGLMARDIRAAGLDPADTDNFGFEVAASTKIRLTADSEDGSGVFNGLVDDANFERITYEFSSDQIVQTLYEGTASQNPAPLIANINNLAFSYFDSNNNDLIDYGLSPPQVSADDLVNIRTVEISITVEEPAGNDEPISRTLTRRVECRNMAFN